MNEEVERSRLQIEEVKQRWLGLNEHQRAALLVIVREIGDLGPKACRILSYQAERLDEGVIHGDFAKGRNWPRDRLQEHMDALNYLSAEIIEAADDALPKAAE